GLHMPSTSKRALALVGAIAATAALLTGCGSSSSSSDNSPTPLSLKISEKGKKSSFDAPKSATGGLVTVSLANEGKAPHGVEFIQYTGNHTAGDVLTQFGSNSKKTPS